jgi:trimethylamine:corrinoid methyltransferase-like protein
MIDPTLSFRPARHILDNGESTKIEGFLNKYQDLHILLAALEDIHCNGNTPVRQERIEDAYRAFRLNVGLVH